MPREREEGQTDVLRYREPAVPMQDRPSPPADQVVPPWRLLLQLGGENRTTLGVTVQERLIVGRENSSRGFIPDIDLSGFDAVENGVSREHAAIVYLEGALFIEDLDSTNGTRINGYELKTGRRYRLRDGDELEFGRLRAVIRFVRPSR